MLVPFSDYGQVVDLSGTAGVVDYHSRIYHLESNFFLLAKHRITSFACILVFWPSANSKRKCKHFALTLSTQLHPVFRVGHLWPRTVLADPPVDVPGRRRIALPFAGSQGSDTEGL